MKKALPYLKAITGALATGLGSLALGISDGSLTPQEYIYAAVAALTALGAIWAVPNLSQS